MMGLRGGGGGGEGVISETVGRGNTIIGQCQTVEGTVGSICLVIRRR